MRVLSDYIVEKLKINKDTKMYDESTVNTIVSGLCGILNIDMSNTGYKPVLKLFEDWVNNFDTISSLKKDIKTAHDLYIYTDYDALIKVGLYKRLEGNGWIKSITDNAHIAKDHYNSNKNNKPTVSINLSASEIKIWKAREAILFYKEYKVVGFPPIIFSINVFEQ